MSAGSSHVVWGFHELFTGGHFTGVTKVLLALVLSPLLGFWAAFAVHRLMSRLLAGARPDRQPRPSARAVHDDRVARILARRQ